MAYLDKQSKVRYYYNARCAIVRKGDNMANITNRNGKFLIRVFTGRDISGKQIVAVGAFAVYEAVSGSADSGKAVGEIAVLIETAV